MAGPTWRNVNAPDFSSSLEGIRTAGSFLERALANAKGLVEGVDKDMNQRADKAFALELAKYQDAAALEQALAANPALGADVRRLSADAIRSGGQQVDSLLAREGTRLDNTGADLSNQISNQNIKTNDITLAREANVDQYRDSINGLIAAGQAGGMEGVNAFLEKNPDVRKAINFDKAIASALGVVNTGVDITGKVQDQKIAGTTFANSQEDRQRMEQATGLAQVIRESNATADGVRTALSEIKDPLVRAFTARELGGDFGSLYGDVLAQAGYGEGAASVSTAGGNFSGDPMSIVNYEARGRGFTAVPSNVQTLGQLESWGKQAVAGTRGKGSSASGPYQITYSTFQEFAEKALGKNWRAAGNTFENHDKVAQRIFESARGSNAALRGRWAAFDSMSDAEVAAVRKMPWEEARQVIAAKESNTDPAAALGSSPAARAVEVAARNSEENNTFGTEDWINGLGRNPPPRAGAAGLIRGGYFPGQSVDAVERLIRDFQKRTDNKASVKQITQILANAPPATWADDIDPSKKGLFGTGFFNARGELESYIDAQVAQFKGGQKERAAVRGEDRKAIMAEVTTAEANASRAQSNFLLLSQSGRASAGEIAKARQQVDAANSALQAARRRFNSLGRQ